MPPSDKRALPLVLMAGSGLILAACSTTDSTHDPLASSGAPVPRAGYDWHLNQDDKEISLAYGMVDTDDVPLDLSCQPRTGTLNILHTTGGGGGPRIQLESGGDTETYPAKAEPAALGEGLDLTAKASSTDPVFLRFRQLGWLAVHGEQGREPYVATPSARSGIEQFFSLCDRIP